MNRQTVPLQVVRWCAGEVERQERGPLQVVWMCDAWCEASATMEYEHKIDAALVSLLGALVEREINEKGYQNPRWRSGPVSIKGKQMPRADDLYRLMNRWVEFLPEMTPEEAYKGLMEIHPFTDGNGRVGALVYNLLNGTINNPVVPPNFWE